MFALESQNGYPEPLIVSLRERSIALTILSTFVFIFPHSIVSIICGRLLASLASVIARHISMACIAWAI